MQPVEIVRDAHAIPHIYAQSPRDGAFAMGYVHAQDRLWQLEMQRRIGQARLAEVVGEPAIGTDKFLRTLGIYRVAERNFERLSPEAQAIYEAYAAGVNAYLEARSELLPLEFQLLSHEPEPWRPADSLVWLKIMAWDLGDNFKDELLRARLAGKLDRAQLQDLWAQHPDDPPVGPHGQAPAFDPAGIDFDALVAALPLQRASGLGSNAWALSGEHTDSGKPLLANDPHLRLEVPSVWYLAHISTPEFEVVGATLPGMPFPLLGRTRNLAWGFTNTGPDVQDLFIERIDPEDPARYLAPEGSLPFEVRTETIEVSGGDPIELTVRETRHGPVVSDVLEESGEFLEAGHVLAFSWTALDDDDVSAQALVQGVTAADWQGFVAALRDLSVPQQTIVFADSRRHHRLRGAGPGADPRPGPGAPARAGLDRQPRLGGPRALRRAAGRLQPGVRPHRHRQQPDGRPRLSLLSDRRLDSALPRAADRGAARRQAQARCGEFFRHPAGPGLARSGAPRAGAPRAGGALRTTPGARRSPCSALGTAPWGGRAPRRSSTWRGSGS